ncbi:hypothetical protein D3C73_572000 [compost metagenome]
MAFAVLAQHRAIRINYSQGVVTGIVFLFIKADRQHHLQLFGDGLEMVHRFVVLKLGGISIIIGFLLLAEIRGFKQLLQQNNLRTLGCSFSNQCFRLADILINVARAAHLRRGYFYVSHSSVLLA